MSEPLNRALRGGARAVTGLVVVAAAVVLGITVQAAPIPTVQRDAVALAVDVTARTEQTLVCGGAFAQLGADPARPSVSVPSGTAQLTLSGNPTARTELTRAEPGGSAPQVLKAAPGEPFAAAQVQQVSTEDLRGLAASTCAEPTNEQWLIGGDSTLGVSTTVSLANPTAVPATVQLTIYDEHGPVDAGAVSGVLVPAGSERTVSLSGYAPGRDRLAVRVTSTGAPVTALLLVSQTKAISSYQVDTLTRQVTPSISLVVPGVTNISSHTAGPNDVGTDEGFPVLVRLLAPAGETGTATVSAMLADGTTRALGAVDFSGASVAQLITSEWPEQANAVRIDATAPVIGVVMGSAESGTEHDYAWFTPAPSIAADEPVAAAVVSGGQLVIANPGSVTATVRLAPAGANIAGGSNSGEGAGANAGGSAPNTGAANAGAAPAAPVAGTEVKIPAGGAVVVPAPQAAVLTSDQPVHAGVRLGSGGNLAGYPVLTALFRVDSLRVYTR